MRVVRWVPDDIVDKCEDCKQAFGLANRKHVCCSVSTSQASVALQKLWSYYLWQLLYLPQGFQVL